MIAFLGDPTPPVPRLLSELAERGYRAAPRAFAIDDDPPDRQVILVGPGCPLAELESSARDAGVFPASARLLVLSLLGAHPDAGAEELRRLWALEERARALGLPILTLRLGPLVGPRSPLWLRLRSQPRLPRRGRRMVQPVAEMDVIETLDRALSGGARWEGWFEVVGAEMMTLAELTRLALESGPPLPADAGSWEPPLEVLERQRLGEVRPWQDHFRIEPGPVSELARTWVA